MVSQETESQLDCNVNIYFVIPNKYSSENDCNEDMWHAFDECCNHSLEPEWISEKKCNKMKPVKNDVFVMEEFEGDTFERLKTSKCSRVVGPRCLLICFMNGEPIPEGTSPVYTTAMRGICVCVSGLSSEKKEHVQKLVEYMGGYFTKQLRTCVTHLVTESVMSAKYENATEMKIPIVTKEWVDAIWAENLKNFVKADDVIFDKYKCPVFMHLVVTSTNLPKRQKEEINRLINERGGIFMGPLDGSKVKVVIAPENSALTDKLKYAMQTNIACLIPDWVYESIKVGYALPFNNFLIKSTKACSTPEKSTANATLNCSAISSIYCEIHQNNYVDESLATTISNFSTADPAISTISNSNTIRNNVVDRLIFSEAKMAGPFLDGCNIYLAGFAPHHRDKLNRILNVGSATRLDDISDALTHVIIGNESKAANELKVMKSKGLCPYILTLEWLEESIKLKRPAPEEHFLHEQKNNTTQKNTPPPSPLSKKNLQMLQQPKRPPIPVFDIDKKAPSVQEEENHLIQQYLQETDADQTMQEFLKPHTSVLNEKNDTTLNASKRNSVQSKPSALSETENKNLQDESAITMSQSTVNEKLFEGLTFIVTGFHKESSYITKTITALNGQVVSSTFTGVPDYGVVPICDASMKHTVTEVITDLFIEDCINQEQIVDIMYYHRPLSIAKHTKPLSGCVIAISMYTGVERTYLSTLATELGAICQDIFARKTNLEKNTYGSTHLICPTPEGNKYNAAVKWKLPAVTCDWLKSCLEQLKLVNETPFLVGETIAPERPNVDITLKENLSKTIEKDMAPPTAIASRNIITPKRHLPNLQNQESVSGETPLINKRLSLVSSQTPQSPFHVSTPETPYGQIFKPNPSPDTRKGWIKWVDNFPDLRVEEPPLKRRAPSTPLSELKRQLWQKLKNPRLNDEENEASPATNNKSQPITPNETKSISQNDNTSTTPINRKLEFTDENSPLQNNQINLQIAQLDQILQRQSTTPESRYSLSGEQYPAESTDHIQKCVVKDSQPVDAIVWEDPSHSKRLTMYEEIKEQDGEVETDNVEEAHKSEAEEDQEKHDTPPKRKFMLSGIKDRAAYEQVIRDLDGDVSTDASFDMTATHLLCIRPSRNEKMLGSIAAGKWVLHCLYLRDSEQEGKFLDEEKYEWGNPKSKGTIPDTTGDTEEAIAKAAYRWRLRLLKDLDGPFHQMTALLLVSGEKYDQFKRLIEAGGGAVVQARPPYDTSPGRRITHCFVNVRQVNQPIDWAMLASKGILCFLPQYLSEHLTAETSLNPRDCVLPEFKKYLTLLPK